MELVIIIGAVFVAIMLSIAIYGKDVFFWQK